MPAVTNLLPKQAAGHVHTPHGLIFWGLFTLPVNHNHAQHQKAVRAFAWHWLQQDCAGQTVPADAISWPPPAMPALEPHWWLSWSYLRAPSSASHVLLAAAPFPVGCDICAAQMLPLSDWQSILREYGGASFVANTPEQCAQNWCQLEATDKSLRVGLQPWSTSAVHLRAKVVQQALVLPFSGIKATIAWHNYK